MTDKAKTLRVFRGGAWYFSRMVQSAAQHSFQTYFRSGDAGFRVVCMALPAEEEQQYDSK